MLENKIPSEFIDALLLIKKGLDSNKLDLNKVRVIKSVDEEQ